MVKKLINFILDLDLTLLCSEVLQEYNKSRNRKKSKKFEYINMEDYYIIFKRPYLEDFLDFLFANFNVSIWTAASKDYALFIIDKIIINNKKNRKIDWVFFSYHCDISKKIKKGSKNLSMLWDVYKIKTFSIKNTFILDDNDEVYETQPNNTIIAKEFQYYNKDSHKDTFLKSLILELKNIKVFNNESIQKINNTLRIR